MSSNATWMGATPDHGAARLINDVRPAEMACCFFWGYFSLPLQYCVISPLKPDYIPYTTKSERWDKHWEGGMGGTMGLFLV